MKLRKLPVALALCGLPFSAVAASLQIVNDSKYSDSEVYVLLSGNSLSTAGGISAVHLDSNPTGVICGTQLSSLTPLNGTTVISGRTGQPLSVYDVSLTSASSSRLWVSYGPSSAPACALGNGIIQFNGKAAPLNTDPYRYDKMEFTYSPPSTSSSTGKTTPAQWNANLTALDFLGIPMRMESVNAGNEVSDSRSFYTSGLSLFIAASELFGSGSIGWNGTNFLRIYGPGTMATDNPNKNSTKGSPAPYPSFAPYLASLVGVPNLTTSGSQSFGAQDVTFGLDPITNSDGSVTQNYATLSIPAYSATYNYTIAVEHDNAGTGYNLKLAGTMSFDWGTNNKAPTWWPTAGNVNITVPLPQELLDRNIYATPLDGSTFTIDNYTPDYGAPSNQLNCTTNGCHDSWYASALGNTPFGWVVANVTSGLVLGLFNRDATANNTADWYGDNSTSQPFGSARYYNDGFYDPYAALIFNSSDAYGFPFSDRITVGTNPLLTSEDPTLRITLLADDMPDTPLVTAGPGASDGDLNVSWQPVPCYSAGCTVSYTVSTWPELTVPQLGEGVTSVKLNGTPGVVYTVKVKATLTDSDGETYSQVLPVQGAAQGKFTHLTVSNTDPTPGIINKLSPGNYNSPSPVFQINNDWLNDSRGNFAPPSNWTLMIGGQKYNGHHTVFVTGQRGANYIPVVLTDDKGGVVYQNTYEVVLQDWNPGDTAPGVAVWYGLASAPILGEKGAGNTNPLVTSGNGCNATTPGTSEACTAPQGLGNSLVYPIEIQNNSLSIGTPATYARGNTKVRSPVISTDCLFEALEKYYIDFPAGPATVWQAAWNPSPAQPGVGRQYSNGNAALIASDKHAWGIINGQAYDAGLASVLFNYQWKDNNTRRCAFPTLQQ